MEEKKSYAGGLTVPAETGFVEETLRILRLWEADAVRDSDGTVLPEEIVKAGYQVYSNYFPARGDNTYAKAHPDDRTHFWCLSERVTATDAGLSFDVMKGYFAEQITPEYDCDLAKHWEAIDRTTGEVVPKKDWAVDPATHTVTIANAKQFHVYTVTFLARAIWDSTQMYNYITNNWTKEKDLPYDVRRPDTEARMIPRIREWLAAHPDTDVVRFTTFFYHFMLVFNDKAKEKYVHWFGYGGSVSVEALEAFEREYGYALRPEHIVNGGCYDSTFRVPDQPLLDYMDFTQRFVAKRAKVLVDEVHAAGKVAMMFLGDNWIGTEPYGNYFRTIGLDAVVGSVGGGVTVRMLTDIPSVKYVEGRFLPYFFPDTFHKGGKPTEELKRNWRTARRAMMVKPLDRIGYGGYLSLAAKFPDFIEEVAHIRKEFADIYARVKNNPPRMRVRVGVLSAWGSLRAWQCFMVAHELWYRQIYSYQGILESLSGLPVEVNFYSFDEIAKSGVPEGVDVLIIAGGAGTAFSGGRLWGNPDLAANIRRWVHAGGGLIGVGEPSACETDGNYFVLSDVFGVDEERGMTLSDDRYNLTAKPHFVTEGMMPKFDYGEGVKNVYALDGTDVLDVRRGEVLMAANAYGAGRAFYTAGLPYHPQNARILFRAMLYVAHREEETKRYYAQDPIVECYRYDSTGETALLNNADRAVHTEYCDGDGQVRKVKLAAGELRWLKDGE